MTISNPFHALKHKSFRYYWLGMCVSMTGTWMQNVAQPWLAYELTNSPFLLSLIGAMQFTPVLLFSLFAGVLVDKFPKKNLLIFTQSSSLVITLILAILVFTGRIQYWHLLITATSLGLVNTIDMPTRQSFIIELVGPEDLMNGIALNSAIFNVARIIGPALGGIIMGYWGVAICFLANSISYGAVLISLVFIKPIVPEKAPEIKEHVIKKIKGGLQYIFSRDVLFITLLILAVVATFAMNFNVLVPVFTIEVLHLKETGFGFLMSMMDLDRCAALCWLR
jgi:MFS family permease